MGNVHKYNLTNSKTVKLIPTNEMRILSSFTAFYNYS